MSPLGRKALLGTFDSPAGRTKPPIAIDIGLHEALEALPHLVWLTGIDGTTDYVNGQFTTYTGRPVTIAAGWDCGNSPERRR